MKYKSKLSIKIEYAGNQSQSCEFHFEKNYKESIALYRAIEQLLWDLTESEGGETGIGK